METKKTPVKAFHYIFTCIIIYITDSLLFGTNGSEIFRGISRYGIVLLGVGMIIRAERLKKEKFELLPFFLSMSVAVSLMLSKRISNGFFYYTMIASIWVAYLFARECTFEQFSYCFCKFMRIIAVVSLICWALSGVIKAMPLPVITNTVGVKYKTLILTNVPMSDSLARRNMGPFWEPGAYQVYLNIALFLALFIEKKNNKLFDAALFVGTCVSTFSGAALIPAVMTIAAYAIEKKQMSSFFLVVIIGAGMIYLYNGGFLGEVTDKLTNTAETNSIVYRWIGIEGAVKGFLENPLFGSSPQMNEYIKATLAYKYLGHYYSSNTNTYLNYFAYFGFFVGGFMLLRAYNLFRKNITSFTAVMLAFGAYFISTSNEELMTSMIIIALTFLQSENTNYMKDAEGELNEGSAS